MDDINNQDNHRKESDSLVNGKNESDADEQLKRQGAAVQNALQSRYSYTINMLKTGGYKFGIAAAFWCLGYFNFSLLWLFCGACVTVLVAEKVRRRRAASEVSQKSSDNPKKFVETLREMYKMSGNSLPSWIYFPDVEKAEWLNQILLQLWPYVGNYVEDVVVESVQPSIRMSSSLLSGFAFTDVDLGDRAPHIAGVKVYPNTQTRRNEIVMDLHIIYNSDCNIGVSVNRLQAGICNLRVRGLLRIELQPLLEKMPLVGAISVSFVKDPTIDFDLTHLANLFDLPGFDTLLRGSISDTVGALFVLPQKYIVKLCPDVDISILRFPMPEGLLRIHVLDAKHLEEKDHKLLGFGGASDPYVTIKVGHQKKLRTRTIHHTVNPVWNETFDMLITHSHSASIEFTLFDDDGALNKADYLGCASLPIRTVFEHGVVDEVITLSEVSTGTIHVRLEWFDLSTDPADVDEALKLSSENRATHSSFLNLYVDGAQHLPSNQQESYEPSPLLKIHVPGGEPLKTKVCSSTSNPVWEENFRILLQNPLLDEILFELEDTTTKFGNLGALKFPVKQLLKAPTMTLQQPFHLNTSGPDAVLNLRISLRILKIKSSASSGSPPHGIRFELSLPPPSTDHNEKVEKDIKPSPPPQASDTHSESNVSVGNSSGSIEFEGTPNPRLDLNKNLNAVGRSPSVASEISHIGEVENLRQRLKAKLNKNETENVKDYGLGRIQLTLRYRKTSLIVLVVKAENLIICDEEHSTSDPYVRVYIIPHKSHRKKTKVMKNSLNPVFDQKLEFEISPKDVQRKKLNVTVKNQTGFLSIEKVLMGQVVIDLSELDLSQPATEWYPLKLPDER